MADGNGAEEEFPPLTRCAYCFRAHRIDLSALSSIIQFHLSSAVRRCSATAAVHRASCPFSHLVVHNCGSHLAKSLHYRFHLIVTLVVRCN
jgi:hypothetical protein